MAWLEMLQGLDAKTIVSFARFPVYMTCIVIILGILFQKTNTSFSLTARFWRLFTTQSTVEISEPTKVEEKAQEETDSVDSGTSKPLESVDILLTSRKGFEIEKDGAKEETSKNAVCNESEKETEDDSFIPLSVNYHFTRQCNYSCGFCFHTAKTSAVLPLEEAKRGLLMLKNAGMKKINFSGGEPFIVQKGTFVGEMVKYCKEDLNIDSVTIVSNGSLIKEKWFETYGKYLDILAISCDSFRPEVNEFIGRQQGNKDHVGLMRKVRQWCKQYQVAFKINSVINTYNFDEDMTQHIMELNPCRWKVFQCLVIGGENAGENALRHAESYVITNEQFQSFLDLHKQVPCLVPESNEKMQNSYLILDEYMRFLDCTKGAKDPSRSILDVGVTEALKFSGFDEQMFFKRGGKYVWSKGDMSFDW